MSILNVARMEKFSSDRSIKEYCNEIWEACPLPVKFGEYTIGKVDFGEELYLLS